MLPKHVWNTHGRKQPRPTPKPVPKSPRRFLFDGCAMTGFVDPSSSPAVSEARRSGHSQSSLYTSTYSGSGIHEENTRKQGAARLTYLDRVSKFSFSPGPTYNTSSLRHNPGPSSPQYSWFHQSASASPSETKPRALLKPTTPGHTSKFSRPTIVDWSTSTLSRSRAHAVAAMERPIESRSGLRKSRSAPKHLDARRARRLRPRPNLPWGNPMQKVRSEPSAMPYYVRFHKQDDRCASLDGNYFNEHLERSEESEVFCKAITELEAHIQLRRKNIWRTLRPKGMDLLNFPKLFYEQ